METSNALRVRRSLRELQDEYCKGNKKPLEDLMRAWKCIKDLPPDHPHSFFMLGGYHGEPFRGAGWGSANYWGGYCNHGNILFPTWHRVYLLKLEEALRSIPGCQDVTLPYWDETSKESVENGIPWALTDEKFTLDGVEIDNPLRSFVFNKGIKDFINGDNPNYSKPKGYETVRYPLSGLVGTEDDRKATEEHNAKYPDYDENVKILNENVKAWLESEDDTKVIRHDVAERYRQCLDAPNYTVFSNTTSAQQWNFDHGKDDQEVVIPLESPHNSIHLAVGGFDVPGQGNYSPICGANGDMGENDTAGLDPIFFFHHCFVDYVFWQWQIRHNSTDQLKIMPEYPGTNSVDSQGPTPGTAPNSWLTLESPLNPFKKKENRKERPYTSLDCINIETQLGYTYGPGSMDNLPQAKVLQEGYSTKIIHVSGVNRAPISGSFLIVAYVAIGGERHHVGTEAVLSRWNVQYCANCQTHLEVKAFFPLHEFTEASLGTAVPYIEVRNRDQILLQGPEQTLTASGKKLFNVEIW